MKILYVSYFFPPHRAIGSQRAWNFCQALSTKGHQVEVLTTHPIARMTDSTRYSEANQPGFPVHRIGWFESKIALLQDWLRLRTHRNRKSAANATATKSGLFKKVRGLISIIEMETAWLPELFTRGIPIARKGCFDAIIISGRPFVSFLPFAILRKIYKGKLILDMRDPWSLDFDGKQKSLFVSKIESWLLRCADKLLMNTASACSRYKDIHPTHSSKIVALRNSATSIALSPTSSSSDTFELLHGGTLYNRELRPLLLAFKRFCHNVSNARLTLVGRIEISPTDQHLIDSLTNKITVIGVLPFAEFQTYLQRSTASLIHIGAYDMCIPGKFYECLSYCKPMLFLGNQYHELVKVIEQDLKIGTAAQHDDEQSIYTALLRLYKTVIPLLKKDGLEETSILPFLLSTRTNELEQLLSGLVDNTAS